jgi:isoquinoline 1-oxidoreductase subunit beta
MTADAPRAPTRRSLLVAGGAGIGLVVAWSLWPRTYPSNLTAATGETVFGAWLKIGEDGHVIVAVPQAEHGQGVYTTLPQLVADELGADWRTVGVEPAPANPLYANPLAIAELFGGAVTRLPQFAVDRLARSTGALTGGSTSLRQWEEPCRRAGAAARVLLTRAAARRWDADWQDCTVEAGFVVHGRQRLRFAELAAAATAEELPVDLPPGGQGAGRLTGEAVARIDSPAKVDGSANFSGDVRLADMVHAAVRTGPLGDTRLLSVDRAAADRVPGVVAVVTADRWAAAAGTTRWAAERGLDAMRPRFSTSGAVPDDAGIATALTQALGRAGAKVTSRGDPDSALASGRAVAATYRVAAGVHAAIETPTATAWARDGRLELWIGTQAPGHAARTAAAAIGLSPDAVVVHPMLVGGGFGEALEAEVAAQAAVLATRLKRPVSLAWSRDEATRADAYRPPAAARLRATLAGNGAILGWRASIAAPASGHALAHRLAGGIATFAAPAGDADAVAGADPGYRIPAVAVDHHLAELPLPTGHLRGGAHGYTCFFTESFLDEIAHAGGNEPVSFRIGMLGGNPRLARCLSTAAALGGWEGGVAGSGQGVACHSFRGSHVAVLAEARLDGDRPKVDRLVAVVDCGRILHPDIVRQQVEGGLIFGLAHALGAATGFERGLASARGMSALALPRLADAPDITVELIRSDEPSGGVGEIAVPPVAPAIANALFSAAGRRFRNLPLV